MLQNHHTPSLRIYNPKLDYSDKQYFSVHKLCNWAVYVLHSSLSSFPPAHNVDGLTSGSPCSASWHALHPVRGVCQTNRPAFCNAPWLTLSSEYFLTFVDCGNEISIYIKFLSNSQIIFIYKFLQDTEKSSFFAEPSSSAHGCCLKADGVIFQGDGQWIRNTLCPQELSGYGWICAATCLPLLLYVLPPEIFSLHPKKSFILLQHMVQ